MPPPSVLNLISSIRKTIQNGDASHTQRILSGSNQATLKAVTAHDLRDLVTLAIRTGNADVITLLSRDECDVIDGRDALCQVIVLETDPDILNRLLHHTDDPPLLRSLSAKPILHLAARHNRRAIGPLIKAGCHVGVKDEIHGDSALHVACFYGNLDAIFSLIQNGADVNATNINGETPLDRLLSLCCKPCLNSMERSRLKVAVCLWRIGFRVSDRCPAGKHQVPVSQRLKRLHFFNAEKRYKDK